MNLWKFFKGIRIFPVNSSSIANKGEIEIDNASGKIQYHNGTSKSAVVTEEHTATLTNKSIDADTNTITNIDNNEIKAGAGIAYSKLNLSNSIVDADINTSAGIARSKIASGVASEVIVNNGSGVLSSVAQLPISQGGTGQSTANNALNALLPSQTSNGGKFLYTNGSTTSWLSTSGYLAVNTVSVNTALTISNDIVLVNASSGALTITLPSPTIGKIFYIKKIDSSLNFVQIATTSGSIDGTATQKLSYQYDSLTITNDGTNFYLI